MKAAFSFLFHQILFFNLMKFSPYPLWMFSNSNTVKIIKIHHYILCETCEIVNVTHVTKTARKALKSFRFSGKQTFLADPKSTRPRQSPLKIQVKLTISLYSLFFHSTRVIDHEFFSDQTINCFYYLGFSIRLRESVRRKKIT